MTLLKMDVFICCFNLKLSNTYVKIKCLRFSRPPNIQCPLRFTFDLIDRLVFLVHSLCNIKTLKFWFILLAYMFRLVFVQLMSPRCCCSLALCSVSDSLYPQHLRQNARILVYGQTTANIKNRTNNATNAIQPARKYNGTSRVPILEKRTNDPTKNCIIWMFRSISRDPNDSFNIRYLCILFCLVRFSVVSVINLITKTFFGSFPFCSFHLQAAYYVCENFNNIFSTITSWNLPHLIY